MASEPFDRLRRLVERGILDRRAAPTGRRQKYVLTERAETSSPSVWLRVSGANGTPARRLKLPQFSLMTVVSRSQRPTDAHGRPVDVDRTDLCAA
ncbi:hypothetical protein GCM10010276_86420 [Streptomyces longisporus]|uniref:Uncharacterized protein n=1 Tax=Streptomyces longisporus TaxID=1948 RepID=A0ABN3NHB3_STRLO